MVLLNNVPWFTEYGTSNFPALFLQLPGLVQGRYSNKVQYLQPIRCINYNQKVHNLQPKGSVGMVFDRVQYLQPKRYIAFNQQGSAGTVFE